jgi:hypothetical protein
MTSSATEPLGRENPEMVFPLTVALALAAGAAPLLDWNTWAEPPAVKFCIVIERLSWAAPLTLTSITHRVVGAIAESIAA